MRDYLRSARGTLQDKLSDFHALVYLANRLDVEVRLVERATPFAYRIVLVIMRSRRVFLSLCACGCSLQSS